MTHREHIEAYFAACSSGSADAIASYFTPEAIVFDTNHPPVCGAATIGEFWSKIQNRWQGASWYVDTCVTEADTAAIEWTMTGNSDGHPFTVRGSEHYRFEDGKIAEIRQYWTFGGDKLDTALVEFPYASAHVYHMAGNAAS